MYLDAYILEWLLFGALIGVAAASARGWSPVGGIIGGALLGILSPLLFFVSGVTRADITKKCPQCAENVKMAAKVCRYCKHSFCISPTNDVESKSKKPKPRLKKKVLFILVVLFAIGCLLSILELTLNDVLSLIKSETTQSINNESSISDQDNQMEVVGIWKDKWGEWSILNNKRRYILRVVFNQDGSTLEYQIHKRWTTRGDRFDKVVKTEGIYEYWIINSKGNLETWDQDGLVNEIGTEG